MEIVIVIKYNVFTVRTLMEQITSSFNLFVDSSQGHNTESKGDDYNVNLQDANIKCGDGEHFRMTLNNFSMAKNFHDVNDTNNLFRLKVVSSVANKSFDQPVFLTPKNYASVHDLATEFADKIRESLVARLGGTILPHTNLLPGANVNSNTGIISFTVNTSIDHNITSAIIQFNSDISESYALLGGDRVENGTSANGADQQDTSTSSVIIIVSGARTFQNRCLPGLETLQILRIILVGGAER